MKCPRCNLINPDSAIRCDCGYHFDSKTAPSARETSGQGSTSIVPNEIRSWNWGAFFLTWIWGLSHQVFISLLVFVPVLNIVWPFVLGAKGSQWAWQHKKWHNVDEFRRHQRIWGWSGLVVFVLGITLWVTAYLL